jgi:hypothetical protein
LSRSRACPTEARGSIQTAPQFTPTSNTGGHASARPEVRPC